MKAITLLHSIALGQSCMHADLDKQSNLMLKRAGSNISSTTLKQSVLKQHKLLLRQLLKSPLLPSLLLTHSSPGIGICKVSCCFQTNWAILCIEQGGVFSDGGSEWTPRK